MFEQIPAADREAWLALRGKDVTASVAGALLGVHEYMTAYELWGLKSGRIKQDPEETPAMRRGTLLEKVAVDILREEKPDWEIHHNTGETRIYYRDTDARVGATPDIIVHNADGLGLIQVKSVEQSIYRQKWLTPERDVEPPLWIAVQALIEGHLIGADWVKVAPLVIGFGIEMPLVDVPHRPAVIDMVYEKTRDFWKLIEDGGEMPPDFARDGEAIERMFYADDGSEMDLTRQPRADEIVKLHAEQKAAAKAAKARIEELDAEMKAILGNHAVGVFADGRRVSWKTQTRREHTVRESTFRVLRYPKE